MRADRLVAVLLLLQQRGHVTAGEVAAELEVSERTARRDLEALGTAGLPVYALRGRGGGWRLAGRGRTDLSGLTGPEARALFALAGPQAANPHVRAALRKLLRALPEPLRDAAQAASSRIVIDPAGWDRSPGGAPAPRYLDVVQQAVVDGEQLRVAYTARDGSASARVVHPLGLVAKGSTWYLFAGTDAGPRSFRVDRITGAEPLAAPVERPGDFDLGAVYGRFVEQVDQMRTPVRARVLAGRDVVGALRVIFGTRVAVGPPTPDGRVEVQVRGHGLRALAAELAGFGELVEVAEPDELRGQLAAVGAELARLYGPPGPAPPGAAQGPPG